MAAGARASPPHAQLAATKLRQQVQQSEQRLPRDAHDGESLTTALLFPISGPLPGTSAYASRLASCSNSYEDRTLALAVHLDYGGHDLLGALSSLPLTFVVHLCEVDLHEQRRPALLLIRRHSLEPAE